MLSQAGHRNSRDGANDAHTLQHPDENYDKDDYVEQALNRIGHWNVSVDQPHDQSSHHQNDNDIY